MPVFRSMVVTIQHWKEALFATAVGIFMGALPGLGSVISNIFSYDQVKRFSKNPELFGTGIPAGIVASEAANSSVAGGSLIPMITLGIPGNAISAIMFGAVILHGIQPGPLFMSSNPELTYGLFTAFVFANFAVLLLQILFVRVSVKVLNIPMAILVPFVFVFCVVGAYSINFTLLDMYLVPITGILAYGMVKVGIPLAPFIIGLILTPIAETNLRIALMTSSDLWLFVTRPISGLFLFLTVLSLVWSIRLVKGREQATK